jgi:hypothetical protein
VGSGGSDIIQAIDLTVDEARIVFESIRRACDAREIVETKAGQLTWVTDARVRESEDTIVIVFDGSGGSTRAIARRDEVMAAVAEFAVRFGLNYDYGDTH